jgi:glycosyltransferase involved in cell wall biosynthesis
MREGKPRVLLVSSQPIQNSAPLRLMDAHPSLEVLTAFCSLPDAKLWRDDEHLNKEVFDTPVLDGYNWTHLRNWSPLPSLGKFYGLINPGVVPLVLRSRCCVVFGHSYVSFWLAICAAKLSGKPLILTTDATHLESAGGANWKTKLKRRVLPFLYNRIADMVLVPSTAARRFICSLGVNEERIELTPYVVDNDCIADVAARSDRQRMREEWQVPMGARVLVFCAKFLARKRPQDALAAFARANVPDSYLVMVGDGPLMDSLKMEAARLGVMERVHFTGLVKYSRLPEVYAAADVLVFTSEHEPYGLPVNEAMICGLPVVASDRIGAALDLVREGETGFTYPCGDVEKLADTLREILTDDERLRRMGAASRERMQTWSPRENAEATLRAVEKAIAIKGGRFQAQEVRE